MTLATHAPMCTMGPSGPIGSPAATEQMVPTNFETSVLSRSRLGTWLPFRYAITRVTPAPALWGAQYCT